MNVIQANILAKVYQPVVSIGDLAHVIDFSVDPVIAWTINEAGHATPVTALGQPEGDYMVKFSGDDGSPKMYVPQLLESFYPFVTAKYPNGEPYERFSKELVIAKFQAMRESR